MKVQVGTRLRPETKEFLESYGKPRRWSVSQTLCMVTEEWVKTVAEKEKKMSKDVACLLDSTAFSILSTEKEARLAKALKAVLVHVEDENPILGRVESILKGE